MKYLRTYSLVAILVFPIVMMGRNDDLPADNLCKRWITACNEYILNQEFDKAEKCIIEIENTQTSRRFAAEISACKMNLAFFKAMDRYHHAQYEDAISIANGGLPYCRSMQDRSQLLKIIGDSYVAVKKYEMAKSVYESIQDYAKKHHLAELYAKTIFWIAKVNREEGNIELTLNGFKAAYEHLVSQGNSYARFVAAALKSLYKHQLFNEEKAAYWAEKEQTAENLKQQRKIGNDIFGSYSFITLAFMKASANKSFSSGNRKEAIDEVSRWISGAESSLPLDSALLADAYWYRASLSYISANPVAAMKDLKKALSLVGNHRIENRELLYRIWDTAASCLAFSNSYEKALDANKQALGNAILVYGKNSIKVANLYYNRAYYEGRIKKHANQLSSFCRYNSIIQERVCSDFAFLNKQERAAYWKRLSRGCLEMPLAISQYGKLDTSFSDSLYNHLLLTKGLLLEADIIESRSDRKAGLTHLRATTSDVRSHLSPKSAAIEFTTAINVLDTTYFALILTPDTPHAQLVSLGKSSLFRGTQNSLTRLNELVWKPLEPFIAHTDTVYFSPSGILSVLPIESVQDQHYQRKLLRLSSTRVLIFQTHLKHRLNKASVFGGLHYDAELPEEQTNNDESKDGKTTENLRGAIGEIPYLPHTIIEAGLIASTLQNANILVHTYTGEEGNEQTFCSLDRQGNAIIHIATHGFYTPTQEKSIGGQDVLKLLWEGDTALQNEWDAMQHCGLYMSGAQHVFGGETLTENIDGILTAHEISQLDLSGLQLLSLSACQTADGDITSDGVFGLQRGFKKAGALSILMSLWKVDDEATCILMTEFYRNWISEGKTKHDALEAAKQTVRLHTERGWDDPKYWAAFILLDGLD